MHRVIAGLVLLLPLPALAAEDCTRLSTQLEMNFCAGRNREAADAALNEAYRRIVARLGTDTATLGQLREAQRAWIAFQDAECTFAASGVEGGSIYPMIHADCLREATEARTAALQTYLDCAEGDLSCPLPPAP